MGLLDDLGARIGDAGAPPNAGGQSGQLAHVLLQMLNDHGGIPALAQLFQQQGLGDVVSSWIGTGQNQPVSAQQVTNALGQARVEQLGQRAGVPTQDVGALLAQLLPGLIDKLTPQGQVPTGNQLLETGLGLLAAHFGAGTGGRS